ncbi:MAG: glutamate 5-kinase [Prevotellaceae bacterium]|jgi:glutamate 5-kinase|nr:glutamate 5-kinase [Prevotellaceae bacterium]
MNQPGKRIAVKVGSNVLTRPDGTLDITRMSALVDQIAELHSAGIETILISSGAVAAGRSELRPLRKLDHVDRRQLFSAVGQAKLINRYYELFREHGIAVGQVLTTKESFATRRHYLNQRNCMSVMLDNGVIPIVNENDTISVTELMFTDNDELSGLIATMMDVGQLIILSNVDGIYTGAPGEAGSTVIREVTDDNKLTDYIRASRSDFGRGGMLTKAAIARQVAAEGIAVVIANGKREQILTHLLQHPDTTLCTRFTPAATPMSGVKKWIAHSSGFAKGEIHLNEEASHVLCSDRVVSILPIGITRVEGDFEKDDIVRIIDHNGHQTGVGKVAYNSDQIRAVAGRRGGRAVVHYDYLTMEN